MYSIGLGPSKVAPPVNKGDKHVPQILPIESLRGGGGATKKGSLADKLTGSRVTGLKLTTEKCLWYCKVLSGDGCSLLGELPGVFPFWDGVGGWISVINLVCRF